MDTNCVEFTLLLLMKVPRHQLLSFPVYIHKLWFHTMTAVNWSRLSLSSESGQLESTLKGFGIRKKGERSKGYYSAERTGGSRYTKKVKMIGQNSSRFLVLVCSWGHLHIPLWIPSILQYPVNESSCVKLLSAHYLNGDPNECTSLQGQIPTQWQLFHFIKS